MKFDIYHSGGNQLGQMDEPEEESVEFPTKDKAENYAYDRACEDYDSYAGLHGIRDVDDIVADEEAENEDDAWDIYRDERDSSVDYKAVQVKENPKKEEIKKNAGV